MLASINIKQKIVGTKELFTELHFTIETKEKVAIIGRNGVGKTTLFGMLAGVDADFEGDIHFKRGVRVVSTAQEHHSVGDFSALEYILQNLPDYAELKQIIDTYPDTMSDDMRKIEIYANALEYFSARGYYRIETDILLSLNAYQIDEAKARLPLARLSGGQKRFVELVRVEHSNADIALIDEPTNHMDYAAKAAFIEWLKTVRHTVVVITHDRDVLEAVDRIIEIKDGLAHSYAGNYSAYLKQNVVSTTTKMHGFEVMQRQMTNLEAKIIQFRRLKEKARDPDTIKQFKRRETEAETELAKLETIEKPSFWIDRESSSRLKKTAELQYDKYKARNIRIRSSLPKEHGRELLNVEDIELGYDSKLLFSPLSFRLQYGKKLQIVGRNGTGKTTLVKAIAAVAQGRQPDTHRGGNIVCDRRLRLSTYEQEIQPQLLHMTLFQAIETIYQLQDLPITNENVYQLLSDYMFDPMSDGQLAVSQLSGGQKARLQIIRMLATEPNLLILDEPTNHLDLPSIEELEQAMQNYHGALLYISHDSYFAKNIGGEQILLQPTLTM